MLDLFATILPLAIASAASPVILGVSIALLSKKNFGAAAAFLAGGVLVAAILATVGSSIAAEDDIIAARLGFSPAIVDLAIGIIFLAFGLKILLEKPNEKERIPQQGKTRGMLAKWLAIGFIANITNLDAVLLNIAAVREIFNSAVASMQKFELLLFCDFFFLLPALAPILFYLLAPAASQRILVPIGAAMKKYGRYIVGAIFLLFGAVLVMKGI